MPIFGSTMTHIWSLSKRAAMSLATGDTELSFPCIMGSPWGWWHGSALWFRLLRVFLFTSAEATCQLSSSSPCSSEIEVLHNCRSNATFISHRGTLAHGRVKCVTLRPQSWILTCKEKPGFLRPTPDSYLTSTIVPHHGYK